jgi:hypothetical protein
MKQRMPAAAFGDILAHVVHRGGMAAQFIAGRIERSDQRAHIIRRVFISACEGTGYSINHEQGERIEISLAYQGNQPVDTSAASP